MKTSPYSPRRSSRYKRPSRLPFKLDFIHTFTRRDENHDYYSPCTYHIIFKKAKAAPDFSSIVGNARIKHGIPGCAAVKWSPLGRVIADTIYHFKENYPIIHVYCYCVMPDHVHILLRVTEKSKYHLGYFMSKLSGKVGKTYSEKTGKPCKSTDIFQKGYTDKHIYSDRSLDTIHKYIDMNPHRRAMVMQYPVFFRRIKKLKIGTGEYEAYGNLFHLRNPDKSAVKISSKFTEVELRDKCKKWLRGAATGTVLVSPFISDSEKEIREVAEQLDGKFILITYQAFPERFKPADHDFELCSSGRLLIISLGEPPGTRLSRELSERMNALAAEIADGIEIDNLIFDN